jgi:methyltransferase (TIGR00027 family)
MAARSRYAEDQLARAVERGTRQYVILGAGLDTFAYRNPHAQRDLRVFEVDHPATQEWKRERLAAAGIAIPASVTFAPVDFEHQTLQEALQQAGFDAGKAAFFSWLGVTMYLARDTVMDTFRFIASCSPGGGVAFDYMVPPESLSWKGRLVHHAISRRVAKAGEPFRTFFAADELRAELGRLGFREIENLEAAGINERYFKGRADGLRVPGLLGRLMSAQV